MKSRRPHRGQLQHVRRSDPARLFAGLLKLNPHGRRLDGGGGLPACIFSSAAGQPADRADVHIVIAYDLAAQPDAGEAARLEHIAFGYSHALRLAFQEFDAARSTACMTAARMELVDSGVFFQREDESLTGRHFELAGAINGQFWHCFFLSLFPTDRHPPFDC
jgi:hypothetical protein